MYDAARIRTDIALEARELWQQSAQETTELDGVSAEEKELRGFRVTRVSVLDEEGEKALCKPIGDYITIELDKLIRREENAFSDCAELIGDILREMLQKTREKTDVDYQMGADADDQMGAKRDFRKNANTNGRVDAVTDSRISANTDSRTGGAALNGGLSVDSPVAYTADSPLGSKESSSAHSSASSNETSPMGSPADLSYMGALKDGDIESAQVPSGEAIKSGDTPLPSRADSRLTSTAPLLGFAFEKPSAVNYFGELNFEAAAEISLEPVDLPIPSRLLKFPQASRETDEELILVAGLGNAEITPDAIGPWSVDNILVTRHLKALSPDDFADFSSVAALRSGVLGTTGIESAKLVSIVAEELKPSAVIVIDALASKEMDRLCRTLQITNTGIVPGSGVGNSREALNRATLGVPVIAIGVPTVVDAATLAIQLASKAGLDLPDDAIRSNGMIVTPRDIDSSARDAAKLVGYGVNLALHKGMTVTDVDMFLN